MRKEYLEPLFFQAENHAVDVQDSSSVGIAFCIGLYIYPAMEESQDVQGPGGTFQMGILYSKSSFVNIIKFGPLASLLSMTL